jgi:hypothetical protein
MDEILAYNAELATRIDVEQLIQAGSREEVEIRACALHAVELIGHELRAAGNRISSMEIDHILWNKGQHPFYKKRKPRHRTRTVYY